MAEQKEKRKEHAVSEPSRKISVKVDLTELYKVEPSDLVLEIAEEHYSNLAVIQATQGDVYIDFLPMPGVMKDGKRVLKGTRVFMSHSAAKNLADTLGRILENVNQEGGMDTYTLPKGKKIR